MPLTGMTAEPWCCWPAPAKQEPVSQFRRALSLRLSVIPNDRHVWPGFFGNRRPTS